MSSTRWATAWRRSPATSTADPTGQSRPWRRAAAARWRARMSSTDAIDEPTVLDDEPAGDHGVTGGHRAAAQPAPRSGRRGRRRTRCPRAATRRGRRTAPTRQLADLAVAAEAGRAAAGGHLQRVAAPAWPRARARSRPSSMRVAGLHPQRRRVGRRRAVAPDARPARRPPAARAPGRGRRRGSWLELGQWATPVPQRPSRSISSWFGIHAVRHPGAVRRPADVLEVARAGGSRRSRGSSVSSSTSSARWVCRRTSSRSASSAVARISSGVTENGEHGASATRTMACGPRSWCTADQALGVGQDRRRRPAPRSRAGGRRPSATGSSSRGWRGSACPARWRPGSRR